MSYPYRALTLERVSIHFEEWRTHRPHSRSPIPEELWSEAVELCESYRASEVCEVLRLNPTCLAQKRRERSETVSFVEVSVSEESPSPSPVAVEVVRGDGMCLRLSSLGQAEFHFVVSEFLQGG